MLIGRNHEPIGITDVGPLFDEITVSIKNLHPLIFSIFDIYVTFLIDGDTMWKIER